MHVHVVGNVRAEVVYVLHTVLYTPPTRTAIVGINRSVVVFFSKESAYVLERGLTAVGKESESLIASFR